MLNPLMIEDAVKAALQEDLGRAGDITTLATIPASARAPYSPRVRKASSPEARSR